MVRSSQVYKICTHRPDFDKDKHNRLVAELKSKTYFKKNTFNLGEIEKYCKTEGIKTLAGKVKSSLDQKWKAKEDPLPDGAKTYLEELWLEANHNFTDFTVTDGMPQIQKGNLCEDSAIAMMAQVYRLTGVKKNIIRLQKGFLTGECDVHYNSVIRDMKVPETWKTFRAVKGIPLKYHWQLIAYCYLYNCDEAYLDYGLMPWPEELIPMVTHNLSPRERDRFYAAEGAIKALAPRKRLKTYKVKSDIKVDIEFLESRLAKAEEYYASLTYEKCMKMNVAW